MIARIVPELGLAQHGLRPRRQARLPRRPEVAAPDGRRHGDPHSSIGTVGPFSASIRPFTVNGRQTLCFVNVNELLGFEVGDLTTGKKLHRVEVQGFEKGPVKRHGCPSHGIGLTPDEKELWVADAHNQPDPHLRRDRDAAQAGRRASSSATSRAGSPSASTAATPTRRPAT